MKKYTIVLLIAGLVLWLLPAATAFAGLTVSIDPSYAQRKLKNDDGHNKIRMHVTLSGAENLISFGVKLVYDHTQFIVLEQEKNDTVWDAGMESTQADNEIYFIGGSSTPVSGDDILLGWVVFQFKGCPDDMPLSVPVTVEPAKDLPFDNFVDSSGTVKDDEVTFEDAEVCLVHPDVDACEGDFNGDGRVVTYDSRVFKAAYPSKFPDENYNPACDFNADGRISSYDSRMFKPDYPRSDCPSCE